MHSSRDLYNEAAAKGHILYNYPMRALYAVSALQELEKSLVEHHVNSLDEYYDVFAEQMMDTYPGFEPSDEGVELFFQMNHSAPAFIYDEDEQEVTLLFQCGDVLSGYYTHVLSLEDMQCQLDCAFSASLEREKRICNNEKSNQFGVPLDLVKRAAALVQKNCIILAEATGYNFDDDDDELDPLSDMRENMAMGTASVEPEAKDKLVDNLSERMREQTLPYDMLDTRISTEEIAFDFGAHLIKRRYLLN